MMIGPAVDFNRPGLERDLPGYIDRLAEKVHAAEKAVPKPDDLDALRARLAVDRFFLEQKRNAHLVIPNVTYSERMTIDLGDREVEIRNGGRAVTPGDTYLYLPREKVLVTGDLLVNPISFALSCYPSEWLHVLEQLDGLDAVTIVPGHGAPLHDKSLLHTTMAVFRRLIDEGKAAKAKGLDPDQAQAAIMPGLHDLMVAITGDDAALNGAFKVQLVDWFLHRVWDEADGKLTDAIAPIPRS
jgi:glyoxylase-like metal-dependent hydrolase (beta-lactamase superfamily II)